jgi:hypothetical protein
MSEGRMAAADAELLAEAAAAEAARLSRLVAPALLRGARGFLTFFTFSLLLPPAAASLSDALAPVSTELASAPDRREGVPPPAADEDDVERRGALVALFKAFSIALASFSSRFFSRSASFSLSLAAFCSAFNAAFCKCDDGGVNGGDESEIIILGITHASRLSPRQRVTFLSPLNNTPSRIIAPL